MIIYVSIYELEILGPSRARLGSWSEKNGIMWGKFPSGGPPPSPPVWETPFIKKKKVGFIFHCRTSGTFLVFTKKSQFLGDKCRHQEVGLGQAPPRPSLGIFPT